MMGVRVASRVRMLALWSICYYFQMGNFKRRTATCFLGGEWNVSPEIDALWYRASLERLIDTLGLKDFDVVVERDENREPEGLRFSFTIWADSEKITRKRAERLFAMACHL